MPRSLSGQLALLIAVALFAAQAVNFGLLLEGRRQFRLQQIVGPTVARIIDVEEAGVAGRLPDRRLQGRVKLAATNPLDARQHQRPDIEQGLRTALAEAGVLHGAINTEIRSIGPDDPHLKRFSPRQAQRYARIGAELLIAVERRGGGWILLSAPWSRNDFFLIWQLVGQTLILYVIVLLPLLWAARYISRPLQSLANAARQFTPGAAAPALPEAGPADVRAVIAAFNALRLRVTAMLEEKDRMLGAIGHDLRTPLAALRVRIESVDDDDDRARMADTIDEMNRTLDDILSLARLGRPSEGVTDVDLAALVDAVVEDFVAIGSPVTFVEADRLKLALRPSLMRRAIRNLIENAVKYGRAAEVRLVPGKNQVAIVVADQGPGIPLDKIETVFDAFTRLESSRNRETGGAGLGLALARAIVREAGGDVTLVNRPANGSDGGGLDATIILPRLA
ncbi:MAG: two-component sensor histidine kinase [Sphingomonas sp. 28-66-16]|nr:MAG: two-component sensor histidine kinase [Sphingomonas sp. 28-66-16]